MKSKDGKPGVYPNKSSRVPMALIFVVLCGISFYLGGIYCPEKNATFTKVAVPANGAVKDSKIETALSTLQMNSQNFPECGIDFQDYTPCTDPKRWRKYGNYRLSFMERHCPPMFERKQCLVPPPTGYKPPIKWPKSRDQCWYRNVPYEWINNQKSNQHWLKKEGDKFLFPGGGTMFPNGVGAYVDLLQDLVPGMKDGNVRTAIDTGCGVSNSDFKILGGPQKMQIIYPSFRK